LLLQVAIVGATRLLCSTKKPIAKAFKFLIAAERHIQCVYFRATHERQVI